ncbi:hypothetical protein N658DRAFT_269970 [Parathielavia hyrcaniae]|uniref:Uncharacterized protein n=1 Tax=Parathielavia hyrcaniae TaxID=113614 RepID=A0AAN6SYG6_9PEZI|nr:hypothetical protein N658DRAFT_269970 [Parathielavia hyrcaniae]
MTAHLLQKRASLCKIRDCVANILDLEKEKRVRHAQAVCVQQRCVHGTSGFLLPSVPCAILWIVSCAVHLFPGPSFGDVTSTFQAEPSSGQAVGEASRFSGILVLERSSGAARGDARWQRRRRNCQAADGRPKAGVWFIGETRQAGVECAVTTFLSTAGQSENRAILYGEGAVLFRRVTRPNQRTHG